MASDDPNFETKATGIIGVYLNPPEHAAVFCVDEKTAIQAVDLPDALGRHRRYHIGHRRTGAVADRRASPCGHAEGEA
jgi:hypothetical protein